MPLHTLHLDTNTLPPPRRRHALGDFLSSLSVNLECTPLQSENWSVTSKVRILPGGHLSASRTSPMRTMRTREESQGHLVVALMSEAFRIERSGGRDLWGSAGDLHLGIMAPRDILTLGKTYDTLAFSMDPAVLAPFVRDLDPRMRPVAPTLPAVRLMADYLHVLKREFLNEAVNPTPDIQALAANHLRDLTALLLGARADAQEVLKQGGVRAARLAAIRDYMTRHFHEPNLNAEAVGKALGISPRYVRRLLEESGETFAEHLASLRMDAAYRSLTSPLEAGRTISEIAYAVGYAEFSTFFRHFRQRWGMSPSEARTERSV